MPGTVVAGVRATSCTPAAPVLEAARVGSSQAVTAAPVAASGRMDKQPGLHVDPEPAQPGARPLSPEACPVEAPGPGRWALRAVPGRPALGVPVGPVLRGTLGSAACPVSRTRADPRARGYLVPGHPLAPMGQEPQPPGFAATQEPLSVGDESPTGCHRQGWGRKRRLIVVQTCRMEDSGLAWGEDVWKVNRGQDPGLRCKQGAAVSGRSFTGEHQSPGKSLL